MKYVKAFHLSPNSEITKFRGKYWAKMNASGVFVCESWKSLIMEWSATLLSKRFGQKRGQLSKENAMRASYYKNLTLYCLRIPEDIFNICKKRIEDLREEAYKKDPEYINTGTWSWGVETFILEEYLDKIEIIGKKTYLAQDLHDLYRAMSNREYVAQHQAQRKMEEYRKEIAKLIGIFGRAPLLDRADRYANNKKIHILDYENPQRHYKVIEDLIAPYRRQLKKDD